MRVVVTGSTGQLGQAIKSVNCKKDLDFIFLDPGQLNLRNLGEMESLLVDLSPTIIINTAAWTNVDQAETNAEEAKEVNTDGPANLSKISSKIGASLIQISTDYVFSGESNKPWDVTDPVNPKSVYGATKSDGEKAVLSILPTNSIIMRTSWLYSPFRINFAKTMVRQALKNSDEVRVVDDQLGQPTSALDLANQLIASISKNLKPGIYHATNSGQTTWKGFAEEIFSLVGADPSRVVGISTFELNRPAPRPKYSVLSHDCWANTGVDPMQDWREALSEQIDEIKDSVIREGLV